MKRINVFYGYKGSGKDTSYALFKEINFTKHIVQLSFAEKLRRTVWNLFQDKIKLRERIYGSIQSKEEIITDWEMSSKIAKECNFSEKYWTGRRLLQWFGTEVCREIYSDIWINALLKDVNSSEATHICITDCRFQNEYDALKKLDPSLYKVSFILVKRSDDTNGFSGHASEKDLQHFEYDQIIYNTGSMDDLRDKLKLLEV
jgi:hypothetical protein